MPRRNRPERRHTPADPKFNSLPVQQAINKIMLNGKKGTAERIMYDALARVEERLRQDPLEAFNQALRNVTPQMEVKPRRVGGATYQVPIEIRAERRNSCAIVARIDADRAHVELVGETGGIERVLVPQEPTRHHARVAVFVDERHHRGRLALQQRQRFLRIEFRQPDAAHRCHRCLFSS